MTELVVVLAIIGILAAIAIPTAIHYIRLAEFRKNESNAKTAYLAAESVLTWYRSSGQWEDFRREVIHKGSLNEGFSEGDPEYGRIYAILWNRESDGTGKSSRSEELVQELFRDSIYDKDFMNASIAVEIDVETGQVYSAFYGTRCNALKYLGDGETEGRDGVLDIGLTEREYASRREKVLGYYSVEDVTNVVELKPVRLKVTSINLVNSETLSLNWSGNSRHEDLDIAYTLTFYQKGSGEQEDGKLFFAVVDRSGLQKEGWTSGKSAPLTLTYSDSSGNVKTEIWHFPLTYDENGRFSLTLDAMMSARLLSRLEAGAGDKVLQRSHNTSITRLGGVIPALLEPQDLYAVITAECTYNGMGDDVREYTASAPATSNTENSMFADAEPETKEGAEVLQAKLSRFRHLSNIRFYDAYQAEKEAVFTLSANLDWTASGTGLYDLEEKAGEAGVGAADITKWVLAWKSTAGETAVDFPAIPMLSAGHTLDGNRSRYRISNLRLGESSLPEDAWIEKVYLSEANKHYSHYLGLFCEAEGRIEELILQNPQLILTGTEKNADGEILPTDQYAGLYGVGLLCGRASGALENIAVRSTWKQSGGGDGGARVEVRLANRESAETGEEEKRDTRPAAIGGLIGVLAGKESDGTLKLLQRADGLKVSKLVMEGTVTGVLPVPAPYTADAALNPTPDGRETKDEEARDEEVQQLAKQYSYGIGGIIGYAWTGEGVCLEEYENHAAVTGNLFTGGVCGNLHGKFQRKPSGASGEGTGADSIASMRECFNDGLVLCSAVTEPPKDAEGGQAPGARPGEGDTSTKEPLALEGRYFGGVVGFGAEMWIDDSSSASGRASNYQYDEGQKKTLQGRYVGGILGYGSDSLLTGCSTRKGGYILGADYVGGIAGGLSTNIKDAIQGSTTGGIAVTTNESYVIGWRYVGGIVGKNDGSEETVIENCINNGVAAGYDRFIGGIVGYNGKKGKLLDCASYLSDYNSSIFNTIVNTWNARGSYAGGLAGYNNGSIVFTEASQSITVKSVSSVVVGENYVGGVIGFNDTEGTLDVHYTLIGGRIYGYGDAVGGCIGLNASEELLKRLSDKTEGAGAGQPGASQGTQDSGETQSGKLSLVIKPGSVTGRYYVGGVIGANVIALKDDLTVERIKTDNRLGSIAGEAYVGGLIGYHRTITEEQINLLSEIAEKKGFPAATDAYGLLLPELGDEKGKENCPKYTDLSSLVTSEEWAYRSPYVLTITDEDNRGQSLMQGETNNISISAQIYAGGIVGYCERESELVLAECRNTGSISGGGDAKKVLLKEYLVHEAKLKNIVLPEEIRNLQVSMVGGVVSANLQNQLIDRCVNTGRMDDFVGLGGIVGFNAGQVFNCALEDNFGSVDLDCIGGIAGLNIGSQGETEKEEYKDVWGDTWPFQPGTIAACSTAEGRNLFGGSYVGGIAGYNMAGGILEDNVSLIHVTAAGNYVGGIVGCNAGTVTTATDPGTKSRNIRAASGEGVGGIVGWNQTGGIVTVKASASAQPGKEPEVVAVGSHVSIVGNKKVGGIAGINDGKLRTEEKTETGTNQMPTLYLTCAADSVRAYNGYAGGIVGESAGDISCARNRSGKVTADHGPAGGIVAWNGSAANQAVTISHCRNYGDVNSDDGYAGGITAENYGTISNCTVGPDRTSTGAGELTICSNHKAGALGAIGAVCAVNHGTKIAPDDSTLQENVQGKDAVIERVSLEEGITLSGDAVYAGGIVGINRGIVGYDCSTLTEFEIPGYITQIKYMPALELNAGWLTVGGIAGWNENLIRYTDAMDLKFTGAKDAGFTNYQYLGGITGKNAQNAQVYAGSFTGTMKEARGAVGNCYGGIAGENKGELRDCKVQNIEMTIVGVYTATATSTTREKEDLSSHVGGIAGKNRESGLIEGCVVKEGVASNSEGTGGSFIQVDNGMAGGIAGFNKGTIRMSGDELTGELMHTGEQEADTLQDLIENADKNTDKNTIKADENYVRWSGDAQSNGDPELTNYYYNNNGKNGERVTTGRMLRLTMEVNGNLGGITAYNAPSGVVEYCATGNWYLNNKSSAIGVGTGGIIGMNESEKDLSFLLNRAFVGRQLSIYEGGKLSAGGTNRFAGGIIGNQNNTTKGGWTIANCLNYGTVYGLRTHYSGGIMGQWTGTGGTIEKCRNYGNLQTTYELGWFGASAGIVAQLYHAYENHVYNIISCGNYGNLWGRTEGSYANCANDSAGILGNVTTYEATKVADGQHFTIQVLDCVNGPGVEIYSASMASGIVGFFSCDNAEKNDKVAEDRIAYSTSNIVLRIERCRNYAEKLVAKNHVGGIFGDRYKLSQDNTSGGNTFIKDCYAVKREKNTDYSQPDYPIISLRRNNVSATLGTVDVRGNYFIDESASKTNVVLGSMRPSGEGGSVTYQNPGDTLLRADSNRVYIMQVTGGKYFVARIDPIGETVSRSNCYIDENDEIIKQTTSWWGNVTETKVGKVLFYFFPDNYDFDGIIAKNSLFDDYVRTAYYEVEGCNYDYDTGEPQTDWNTMPAPAKVEFKSDGSRGQVAVTPGKWGDGTESDPFRYHAQLYQLDENGQEELLSDFYFYTENYEFDIPAGAQAGKTLRIEVQSCSMFDNVKPSAYVNGEAPVEIILPTPEIRVELVPGPGGTGGNYIYSYELVNKADYADITGWSVFIKGAKKEIELKGGDAKEESADGIALQQLLVQARASTGSVLDNLKSSPQVAVPVNLPGYQPEIPLRAENAGWMTSYAVSGGSLSDLSITVKIDASDVGNVATPPIYRAELVGTWHKGEPDAVENVVFAAQDILTAAGSTASATFTDLPETIEGIEDLRVRVWYAQSGQGPVYTYHELPDENGANIRKLVKVDTTENSDGTKTETPVWEYAYSLILDTGKTADGTFNSYRWDSYNNSTPSKYLFQWLPAPVLPKQGDTEYLQPTYDEAKELWYTFRWDEKSSKGGEKYIVSLTGIDQSGGNVSIVTNREITVTRDDKGNVIPPQLSVNAETWNYSQVKLTVTRKGDGENGTVGLTSEETYRIATRLERPAQPTVTNPNHNELIYKVEWPHISSEEGCDAYQIYLKEYEADRSALKAELVAIGKPVKADGREGNYTADVNLEAYAGERVVIYVVAQTERDADGNPVAGPYVDSVDGVTYDLRIPGRIKKPTVEWRSSWTYDADNPVTMEAFKQGGLTVIVLPKTDQDMPPGGSTYLFGAYVFDTEEQAEAVRTALEASGGMPETKPDGLLTVYPAAENEDGWEISPVSMSPEQWQEAGGERKQCYRHTLEGLSAKYAGKWIVPVARISSGGGQFSSVWIVDQVRRLPYVKLPTPDVSGDIRMETREVTTYSNPDLPDVNVKENWNVYHTMFQWSGVEQADSCYVTVTPATAGETPVELRIQEPEESETGGMPKAWIKEDDSWTELTAATVEDGKVRFELAYAQEAIGVYTKDGIPIHYKAELKAALEVTMEESGGFQYTLILPDVDHMETESKATITGENLRMTASVSVRADVKENDTLAGGARSEAYVGSDLAEVTLGN